MNRLKNKIFHKCRLCNSKNLSNVLNFGKVPIGNNYNRNKIYELPIKPSPNLPNKKAVNLYPSLCLFEGTIISIGRGTKKPFQHFGHPKLNLYNYSFIPKSGPGSKYPKHENKICYGKDLTNTPILNIINLEWLIETYNQSQNKEDFFISFFDKLAGTDKLRKQIVWFSELYAYYGNY